MNTLANWLTRALLFFFPVALATVAVMQQMDGLAWEAAFPSTVYMQMHAPLPKWAYVDVANALARGRASDGDRGVMEAQAVILGGGDRDAARDILEDGLSHSPANAAGWTLLAEQRAWDDREGAADALSLALELAPADYFLAGRMVRDAGALWDVLPDDSKSIAVNEAPALWRLNDLRPQLPAVLATQGGPEIMSQAFHLEPDELRAMNRYVIAQRLGTRS